MKDDKYLENPARFGLVKNRAGDGYIPLTEAQRQRALYKEIMREARREADQTS
jgi:hypothetical protein